MEFVWNKPTALDTEIEMVQHGSDVTYNVHKLNRTRKGFSLVVCAMRLTISVNMLLCGTFFLVYTIDISRLLLQTVVLAFVMNIDELIFASLAPVHVKQALASRYTRCTRA